MVSHCFGCLEMLDFNSTAIKFHTECAVAVAVICGWVLGWCLVVSFDLFYCVRSCMRATVRMHVWVRAYALVFGFHIWSFLFEIRQSAYEKIAMVLPSLLPLPLLFSLPLPLAHSLCLCYVKHCVYKLPFGWNRRDSAPSSSLNWHCYLHTKIHFIQQLHTNCVVYNKLETHDGFFPMCVHMVCVHCCYTVLSHKTKILNEKTARNTHWMPRKRGIHAQAWEYIYLEIDGVSNRKKMREQKCLENTSYVLLTNYSILSLFLQAELCVARKKHCARKNFSVLCFPAFLLLLFLLLILMDWGPEKERQ